jgi:hypothetical protein
LESFSDKEVIKVMKGLFAILGGLGAGAALMYLFDPNEGNRRRGLIRDRATSLNSRTQDAIGGRVRDLSNRAKGLLHESRSAFAGSGSDAAGENSAFGAEGFSDQGTYNH